MKPVTAQPEVLPESRPDTGRIRGYDLARGIAIFVMVIINSKAVFSPHDTLPLWLCQGIDLLDRRAAVALVMVAGAGITLLSRKKGASGKRELLKRSAFLFLAGTLLSLIWGADILHFYGVFLLMGACCLTLPNRALLATAGLFWLTGILPHQEPVLLFLENLKPGSPLSYLADLLFTGYYPVFPWAVFFLAGMWVGRRDVRHPKCIRHMLAAGCLMLAATPLLSIFFHIDTDLSVPTPWSVISGIGTGLFVISLSMRWSGFSNRPWVAYLASAGKATLTLYVVHILFMRSAGLIPGLPDHFEILWVLGGAILFFIVYMGLMRYWLSRHAKGPLETLMRRFPFIPETRVPETGPLVSHAN